MSRLSRRIGVVALLSLLGLGLFCCVLPAVYFARICPPEPPTTAPSPDGHYSALVYLEGGCYMESIRWRVQVDDGRERANIFEVAYPLRVEASWTSPRDLVIDYNPRNDPGGCMAGPDQMEQWKDVRISYHGEPCQPYPTPAPFHFPWSSG